MSLGALLDGAASAGPVPFVDGCSTVFGSCASASFQAATACASAGRATLKRAIARSRLRATSTSSSARPSKVPASCLVLRRRESAFEVASIGEPSGKAVPRLTRHWRQ